MSEPSNGCLRKRSYSSQGKAMKVVKRLKKQGQIISSKNIYPCGHCGGYHLGHKNKQN